MIGLLKEKDEIEKLQQEYKKLAETGFKIDTSSTIESPEEELILEGVNHNFYAAFLIKRFSNRLPYHENISPSTITVCALSVNY
jgi:hypothetical protein